MMELSMWNENLLFGNEWGLELPVDHSNGLFDDLKLGGRNGSDSVLSFQLQDAVEHVLRESPSSDEDILGMEWESMDLGSFLGDSGDLGSSNDKLFSLETSLYDFTSTTAPEELVISDQPPVKEEPAAVEEATFLKQILSPGSSASTAHKAILSTDTVSHASQTVFDALLSPPSSPEQVAPVISVDTLAVISSEGDCGQNGVSQPIRDIGFGLFGGDDLILDEVNFSGLGDATDSFDDGSQLISSPLSAQDVESTLSGSMPSSPASVSQCSIIESSPELYKVISTNSVDSSSRFSPYSKSKVSKSAKVNRKRSPAEPVPEHVILEQVNKKDRKKLQNKNAAIRYRMKKKEEAQGIKSEEQELEEINEQLRTKVEDLQREIRYMKNLMEDVYKAKGLH